MAAMTPSYLDRVSWIFDIQGAALDFCNKLPTKDKQTDFRSFAIGYHIENHGAKNPNVNTWTKPSPEDDISWWNRSQPDNIREFIQLARDTPDPRLDPRNFVFDGALLQYKETLPSQQVQNAFMYWAHGYRIRNPRLRDMDPRINDDIIAAFDRGMTVENNGVVALGRRLFARYLQDKERAARWKNDVINATNMLRAGKSATGRKSSDETAHLVEIRKPAPTEADVEFVNFNIDRGIEPGSRWVFERTICQNENEEIVVRNRTRHTQRIVHLFALVSADDRVLQRMIVKIIGRRTMPELKYELDTECNIHFLLCGKQNTHGETNPHILAAWSKATRQRPYPPQLGYIYMEYAPYGSLFNLQTRLEDNPQEPQLPEPFLWLILFGMASALYTCLTGHVLDPRQPLSLECQSNENLPRVPGWKPVINPDIKLDNVVLGSAHAHVYPAYKVAKLIDWGLAFTGNQHDTRSQKIRCWIGTPYLCPPEGFYPVDDEFADVPVNMKSCTFNVGLVMISLMEGRYREMMDPRDQIWHEEGYDRTYTWALENLVMDCLNMDQAGRPGVWELLVRACDGLRRWETVYGDVNGGEVPEFSALRFEEEEFRLRNVPGVKKRRGDEKRGERREGDDEEIEVEPQRPKKTRKTSPALYKGKGKGKAKELEGDDDELEVEPRPPKKKRVAKEMGEDIELPRGRAKKTRKLSPPTPNKGKGKGKAKAKDPQPASQIARPGPGRGRGNAHPNQPHPDPAALTPRNYHAYPFQPDPKLVDKKPPTKSEMERKYKRAAEPQAPRKMAPEPVEFVEDAGFHAQEGRAARRSISHVSPKTVGSGKGGKEDPIALERAGEGMVWLKGW